MKIWKLYFFSPESGGTWWETHVYAKSAKEAKSVVENKYYTKKVFLA